MSCFTERERSMQKCVSLQVTPVDNASQDLSLSARCYQARIRELRKSAHRVSSIVKISFDHSIRYLNQILHDSRSATCNACNGYMQEPTGDCLPGQRTNTDGAANKLNQSPLNQSKMNETLSLLTSGVGQITCHYHHVLAKASPTQTPHLICLKILSTSTLFLHSSTLS